MKWLDRERDTRWTDEDPAVCVTLLKEGAKQDGIGSVVKRKRQQGEEERHQGEVFRTV